MMKLFNPKTIERHLANIALATEAHKVRLTEWAEIITSGRIQSIKETALHGDFKSKIIEAVLGYTSAVQGPEHTVTSEQAILRGAVDLALGIFTPNKSQIIAPLELKGAKTKDLDAIMPGRAKSPVQQAWEYATHAPGVKWVLVCNYVELRLYGFGEGTEAYERFDLAKLVEPTEYARFMLLLSAENLLSGRTASLLAESRKEDKDITNELYSDYKDLRGKLITAVQSAAPHSAALDAIAAAQTVLDRVLFTAFAEDTGLLPKRILEKAFEHEDPFNPRPVWDNFKGLFSAIDKGNKRLDVPPYNGGLFAPHPIVDAITLPDEVCEGFKKIGDYDFASQVSVTVLGHIFEQSIADVERLQAIARGEVVEEKKVTGTTGRRKRDGVVYTPDYVARFIVDQTIGAHLREIFQQILTTFAQKGATADDEEIKWKRKGAELEAWEAYRDRLKTLRIVDPACGSGVFLVKAFDFMKAEVTRVNERIADLRGGARSLFDPDSEILTNNLFGVDVNEESVEIAKLSLWVKTARRGKMLDSLDNNLKVGDSLIEDSNFAYLKHGFSWQTAFPQVFEDGGFDIVLGNPPYVRMEFLKAIKPYLVRRFQVVADRADLYAYFFERGLKLLKAGGRLGYISSSSFFKTRSGSPLREFLRGQATIEHVIEFGDIRVFEGVTTYPAILIMQNTAPNATHNLHFWKLVELPETNFSAAYTKAALKYAQASLTNGSWEFEDAPIKSLRDKILKGRPKLMEVYGPPLYGIKTGLNPAFIVSTQTKEELCRKDSKSAELLMPLLRGGELERWRVESEGWWLIYTPKGRVNIDDYLAIKDYLLPYKDKLEDRATKQEWFEIQQDQVRFVPDFKKVGICFPDMSQGPKFSVSPSGSLFETTTFKINGDSSLLALLNSKLYWFLLRGNANALRGGEWRLRLKRHYIEPLPIPKISDPIKARLSLLTRTATKAARRRWALQQAIVRRIPDLCPPGRPIKMSRALLEWWLLPDFASFRKAIQQSFNADIPLSERSAWEDWLKKESDRIAKLTTQIAACEADLNKEVYTLFDLTPAEIKSLEAVI